MKIAILGDTHFGIRNGSKVFSNYFKKFYEEIFFPFLIENNITTVIQTGDLMDNRKNLHIHSLLESKNYFFSKFDEYNIKLITYLGNHDVSYKDTLEINSPSIILDQYKNIELISTPKTINIYNTDVLIIPWICQDNYNETIEEIKNSKSQICFGHLELSGFTMYKGIIAEEGMDSNIFNKFEYVITGHYHSRSYKNNVYYVGTPAEMTWSDYDDQKGFHVFDFTNRHLQFISNPFKMFHKIFYDDVENEQEIKNLIENDILKYKNTYIKLIVQNKKNSYLFDVLLDELYKVEPVDIIVIEDCEDVFNEEINEIDETQDTLTVLYQYVDNIKTNDIDMKKLKSVLGNLYHEALSLEN